MVEFSHYKIVFMNYTDSCNFFINSKAAAFMKVTAFAILLSSCAVSKQISIQAKNDLLKESAIRSGHIGISIYEPATGKYWFNFDADKYFVPASNAKLFTLYAGMKYLGDSLVGLRYEKTNDDFTTIIGTGDPTFLHVDFKNQPILDFLKKTGNCSYLQDSTLQHFSPLGKGWAWDDYQGAYSAERSEMPIYGNTVKFFFQNDSVAVSAPIFYTTSIQGLNTTLKNKTGVKFSIARPLENNSFYAQYQSSSKFTEQWIPFKTSSNETTPRSTFIKLLEDTLHKKIGEFASTNSRLIPRNILHSQPTDSLFKPMMHLSDNFFAEQTLLMVSNERLGTMSDEKIIETLLDSDLADIPQRPKWVDGSGLSRYNLFTPQSFIYILNKLKNEFGLARLKNILPTGGEGTLAGYYQKEAGFIFAKTGSLSNHCAISGFMVTKKNKLLLFSVLVNQYPTEAAPVRRAVEKFLSNIRGKF
jgi:D-alanyl-D-alanine carboxypeptidase/D-alanyl-D-alanine-endopeptidase (penicillin-binding protein 4)